MTINGVCAPWCSSHTTGFLIVNIEHVVYLPFQIGQTPSFEQIGECKITPNTPQENLTRESSEPSDIQAFADFGWKGENRAQNHCDYLVVCTPHDRHHISMCRIGKMR